MADRMRATFRARALADSGDGAPRQCISEKWYFTILDAMNQLHAWRRMYERVFVFWVIDETGRVIQLNSFTDDTGNVYGGIA